MQREYRVCTNCVMDTTDPKVTFNEEGVCTHCRRLGIFHPGGVMKIDLKPEVLEKTVAAIKESGIGNQYDCILGMSGGLDSSYLAYQAFRLGLNPLCVHLDNGWDSELAVKNIEALIKKFKFHLYTHVIDWEEFKDLQLSFLKASVVDIEVLTDHAIIALLYNLAAQKNIKYVLSGWNHATENTMPFSWNYIKSDALNILAIHYEFGSKKIKTFPFLDQYRTWEHEHIDGIKPAYILNHVPYVKNEVIAFLEKECKWKYYGDKHYESIFTRFYQGYILPKKFNIDKRKAHLSCLIHSGQLSREDALLELAKEIYDPRKLKEDMEYVIKKLGLTRETFDEIMNLPVKSHEDYLCSFPPRK